MTTCSVLVVCEERRCCGLLLIWPFVSTLLKSSNKKTFKSSHGKVTESGSRERGVVKEARLLIVQENGREHALF
jgi:hypothetical protein